MENTFIGRIILRFTRKNEAWAILSELLIVIIGTLIAGCFASDYGNFKKAAIIKSELDAAVTYLREGKPSDKVPINRGKEFLKDSADSIFGTHEFEIVNIYGAIDKFNNKIPSPATLEPPTRNGLAT